MKVFKYNILAEPDGKFIVVREDGTQWRQRFKTFDSARAAVHSQEMTHIKLANRSSLHEFYKKLRDAKRIQTGD